MGEGEEEEGEGRDRGRETEGETVCHDDRRSIARAQHGTQRGCETTRFASVHLATFVIFLFLDPPLSGQGERKRRTA